MVDLPMEYWNQLANQILLISALMGGFSLAVLASLLDSSNSSRLMSRIFKAAALSAASFLIAIFAMTDIIMRTTKGFPFGTNSTDLDFPRVAGILGFLVGLFSLIFLIALSGRVKSRKLGKFTSVLGIISCLIVLILLF